MNSFEYLRTLYIKLADGTINQQELDWLGNYFQTGDPELLKNIIRQELAIEDDFTSTDLKQQKVLDNLYQNLKQHIPELKPQPKLLYIKRFLQIAAVLALCVSATIIIYNKATTKNDLIVKHDIAPAQNHATLILANGKRIALNSNLKGIVALANGLKILVKDSAITIQPDSNNKKTEPQINTIVTANGERLHYPLVLADGTRVWLNAASSVSFPSFFKGKERLIKTTGEVYVQVVHNEQQPFKLISGEHLIEDVGTEFDVMNYNDEPQSKVTVIEGSIKLTHHQKTAQLSAGQQAIITSEDTRVHQIDPADAVSWRDGYIHFDRADIKEVMRSLSRWYNVKVIYQGDIPSRQFSGDIPTNLSAAKALQVLKSLNIYYVIDKDQITVSQQTN